MNTRQRVRLVEAVAFGVFVAVMVFISLLWTL